MNDSPLPSSLPAPPPTFDANLWRQKLAGLTDPDYSGDDNASAAEHKSTAIGVCVCLCELFGDSLDRMTLWERIASALATAAAKSDDGDIDRFITLCLEHVRADPAKAARHAEMTAIMQSCEERDLAWRQGFVRYVVGHSYAVLAHSRLAWERIKSAKAESHTGNGQIVEAAI